MTLLDFEETRQGVHRISEAVYHADRLRHVPTLSSSIARVIMNQSPRHAYTDHPRLNPNYEPKQTTAFDLGRAAHGVVLGVGSQYVAIPDDLLSDDGGVRSKAAREWVADARDAGNVPLKAETVDRIHGIAEAVRARMGDMRINLDPARSEMVAVAEIHGVWCRAMIDNAPADPRLPLYDFKTTTNACPDACVRAIVDYGYDVQAAFYLAVWKAATGEDRRFRFIFTEKTAPFETSVIELVSDEHDSADWMKDAREKVQEACERWRYCLRSGQWPGYPANVALVGAPSWHRAKWQDRDINPAINPETAARVTAWQAPEQAE
jgi:hypothetical protein